MVFNRYTRGFDQDIQEARSYVLINTSCVSIKHQSTIARYLAKTGIGITPDPIAEGAYNLQSISATRKKWSGSCVIANNA